MIFPDQEGSAVRVMFYSHNGFGLGHLRRTTTIAGRLAADVPDSSVLMVVGTPANAIFRMPPGVDVIKVPSVIKVGQGTWHPRTLRIGQDHMKNLRAVMIRTAADAFRPHALLVDYVPTGVWGELLPTLRMLKARPDPPKIILGLRDILDSPEATREAWRTEGAYEALRDYYDAIFVYGSRELYDTQAEYHLTEDLIDEVTYCGYLTSDAALRPPAQARAELGVSDRKLIVITAGGGYDAFPMMQSCMDALRLIGDTGHEAIFVTGPLMDPDRREALEQAAQGLHARVLGYLEDVPSAMNAADLVITMAGYNTLMDAVALRCRVLVLPRSGPSAEQRMRTDLLARRGLVDGVDPDTMTPRILATAIERSLASGPPTGSLPCLDGTTHVIDQLRRQLRLGFTQRTVEEVAR